MSNKTGNLKKYVLFIALPILIFSGCSLKNTADSGQTSGLKRETPASDPTPTNTPAPTSTPEPTSTPAPTDTPTPTPVPASKNGYLDGETIGLDLSWKYADMSAINTGESIMYLAKENRNNVIVAVNAGHGTYKGSSQKTYSHPDGSPKLTGGTTAAGSIMSTAVSSGMEFNDGTAEAAVVLELAGYLKDYLLEAGFDVLMIRPSKDVQLDNVARTVIANNVADMHIAIHFNSDSYDYDVGAFYISVPDGLKTMEPVASVWEKHEILGEALIDAVYAAGLPVRNGRSMDIDLTQTSYSTIPSVDIEMGNQCSDHSSEKLKEQAAALKEGVEAAVKNLDLIAEN
ncbi:MAG: N-acetylmuramoyl-L-alanine amidase [Lachnospiraceae bacterium]|nr:N-acetylmuramoyl-L-alanine amidase [Lachnospiraceae bacterium]